MSRPYEPGIPGDELQRRRIYVLLSRNLDLGVWDGEREFIGIREKFGARFLDAEDLWTEGGGTAWAWHDTGIDVPEGILLAERVPGSLCEGCGSLAWWTGPPAPAPWRCLGDCETTRSTTISNDDLFAVLDGIESTCDWFDE